MEHGSETYPLASQSFQNSASDEKTEVHVSALDVFGRRGYFDPQRRVPSSVPRYNFTTDDPYSAKREFEAHNDFVSSEAFKGGNESHLRTIVNENGICKLKHFTTPGAYTVANSVKDDLKNTLGENNATQIYVSKELLLEKRHSFFETLFTHADDLNTSLSSRFTVGQIDQIFKHDEGLEYDSSILYRNRLAALERLRETLEC